MPVDYYGALVFKYPDAQGVYMTELSILWRNASSPASTVRFCDSMDLYRRMPGTAAVKW